MFFFLPVSPTYPPSHLFEPPVLIVEVDHRALFELLPMVHKIPLRTKTKKERQPPQKEKKSVEREKEVRDRLEK